MAAYSMNPQRRRHMTGGAPRAGKAAGATADLGMGTGEEQPQSVTITRQNDGSFSCDCGAEPSAHATLAAALDYAEMTLGGGEAGDEEPAEGAIQSGGGGDQG